MDHSHSQSIGLLHEAAHQAVGLVQQWLELNVRRDTQILFGFSEKLQTGNGLTGLAGDIAATARHLNDVLNAPVLNMHLGRMGYLGQQIVTLQFRHAVVGDDLIRDFHKAILLPLGFMDTWQDTLLATGSYPSFDDARGEPNTTTSPSLPDHEDQQLAQDVKRLLAEVKSIQPTPTAC